MRHQTPIGIFGGACALFMACLPCPVHAETPLHFGWSSVNPYTADFDGDGRGELGLYDPDKGAVYVHKLNGEKIGDDLIIAGSGFLVACADFDGDGKADPASFDLTNGVLYAYLSGQDYRLDALPCVVGASTTRARPADFDGDGKADFALYDSALGLWVVYLSASGCQPVAFYHMAGAECQAVPADYDGDGRADPAVYDGASGLWMATFSGSGYAPYGLVYGGPGCAAAPADFDGDGKADPAVYCAALGLWGVCASAGNYAPNLVRQGGPGCVPVPGKYYFTNRADYAVYNATNGAWTVAYRPLGGIWGSIGKWFLKGLVTGAGKETGSDIMGWSLRKIFHHGEDPGDPHWAEEQQMLSEMNAKLDDLLVGQQAISNMLTQLSEQLEYDKNQIEWLISQSAANQAITIIESHFDQHGIDGYASFYQCDTNHPPSSADVDYFANIVLGSTYNMKTAVDNVYRALVPVQATTTNGVLQLWSAMALPTLTPDNLLDNFQALTYYFATMYNYQMKGAVMYVDASRVRGTSEWAKAATANWITNDLAGMVRQEVDAFRETAYAYILAAIKAGGYDPLGGGNPMQVTNVAEVLAALEFFSRNWLGQDESLCATLLAADRSSMDVGPFHIIPQAALPSALPKAPAVSLATNRATGLLYGYSNPDIGHIVATNGYRFVRVDFGRQPMGRYLVCGLMSNAALDLGTVTVSNYDAAMQPTDDPSVTNWFGHLYLAPFNLERLALPLDDPAWAANLTDQRSYLDGHGPSSILHFYWTTPGGLENFETTLHFEYDMDRGRPLPSRLGQWPWHYLYGFPFTVSNCAGLPVNLKVTVEVTEAGTSMQRWDTWSYNTGYGPNQRWTYSDCCGLAGFATNNCAKWTGQSRSEIFPQCSHGEANPLTYTVATNAYIGMVHTPLDRGAGTAVVFRVGSQVYAQQDCMRGGFAGIWSYVGGTVRFKVKHIVVSFY